jgi:hypothetical protein
MNHSKGTGVLPRKFTIYIPSEAGSGTQVCEAAENILCDRLGGVTSYPARGIFRMSDGGRTSEAIQVLEAYCEADEWRENEPFLRCMAEVLCAALSQEVIACAVDGRMEMIPPKREDFPVPLQGKSVREIEEIFMSRIADALSVPGPAPHEIGLPQPG